MEALMESLMGNVDWAEIGWASWDTLVMVGMSLLFSVLIGLPIGVLLFLTGKRQLLEQPVAYAILSFIVNVLVLDIRRHDTKRRKLELGSMVS